MRHFHLHTKKSWHTSFLASYKKYLAYVLFIFPKKIRQIKDAFHFQLRKLYAKTVLIETSNKTCFQLELAKNSRNTKLFAKKNCDPFLLDTRKPFSTILISLKQTKIDESKKNVSY